MNRWCWACDASLEQRGRCRDCHAPSWTGRVSWEPYHGRGVYILVSDTGLAKIGMSTTSVAVRADALIQQARRCGSRCALEACLPEASPAVERWLHGVLVGSCDPVWADAECLPCHTEWFWPTPALRALVNHEPLVDYAEPEFWLPKDPTFAREAA